MALLTALAAFYSIDYKESGDLIKNFPIHHMYGQFDPLLTDISPGGMLNGRGNGEPCSSKNIKEISSNIKLIHEAREDKTVEIANKMIEKSERIYFLGLDLRNKENLEMFDLSLFEGKNVIATAYNLKKGEIEQIRSTFNKNKISCTISPFKSLETIRTYLPFG